MDNSQVEPVTRLNFPQTGCHVNLLTWLTSQVKSVILVKADEALREKIAKERYAAA